MDGRSRPREPELELRTSASPPLRRCSFESCVCHVRRPHRPGPARERRGPADSGPRAALDNDWGATRLRADRAAGRPFGVPDLTRHAELTRLADELGFAGLWVRDVPLYDPEQFGDAGSVFETFTHVGHLAAVTERAVLGTAAVVLPLRQPLLVAKSAATVDVRSGGRFVLGLASGDRPVEYSLFGADFQGRGATFRKSVEILRAAWARHTDGAGMELAEFGLDARRHLDVLPKPTGPSVPVAIAGHAQQSAEWIS
ncbi:LLM class flavin-dependent oxidoreductase [Streptomyces sp. NPDC087538]|uniref:LLM class flavin-dependent oxidoreductase n=1 Tax=Streptomyces sp. NPDC087538 TaxID=3365797 RepID=UPI003808C3A1